MLGVLGNVPAYDTYFTEWLAESDEKDKFCQTFNKESLRQIRDFYEKNKGIFDEYNVKTYNFLSKEKSNDIFYPKIKLIDMYGHIYGQEKKENEDS